MSFDLKLLNGDISIGRNGTVETVFDNDKLRQDIIKILFTKLGENKFHVTYGSNLSKLEIGGIIDQEIVELDIQSSAEDGIKKLISMQINQSRAQYLTPGESAIGIKDIVIERDKKHPYIYNILVSVYTKKYTVISETIPVRII